MSGMKIEIEETVGSREVLKPVGLGKFAGGTY